MFTARKRHLRQKRNFLHKQNTFALFNASNIKTSNINKIKLSLGINKLYFVPLYLRPPKLGLGYPMIMIVYQDIKELKSNLSRLSHEMDCFGLCINKKWYSPNYIKSNSINNQNKKLLSLLLYKNR